MWIIWTSKTSHSVLASQNSINICKIHTHTSLHFHTLPHYCSDDCMQSSGCVCFCACVCLHEFASVSSFGLIKGNLPWRVGASQSGLLKDRQPINKTPTFTPTYTEYYYPLRYTHTHTGIPHSNAMETVAQCRSQAWWSSLSFAVEQRLWNSACYYSSLISAPCLPLPWSSTQLNGSVIHTAFFFFFFQSHISIVVCWLFFCCWRPLSMIQHESLLK